VRPPTRTGRERWLRPAVAVALACGVWLAVVGGFRLAGHWHGAVSEAEYHRRLGEIDSPLYTHVNGMAMQEPTRSGTAATVPAHR
jgi:hypothetical protein